MSTCHQVDIDTLMTCYGEWQHLLNGTGKLGFGTNSANLAVGVFIATGQDVASVESYTSKFSMFSMSPTEMSSVSGNSIIIVTFPTVVFFIGPSEAKGPGVYISISLPSLNVGTVGGGTSLATQRECLDLIDCHGKVCTVYSFTTRLLCHKMQNGTRRLCELIAGFSLSLEVSTLAALASGQFASAHEKLGRNHPTLGFKADNFNMQFFSSVLGSRGKLLQVVPFHVKFGSHVGLLKCHTMVYL